MRASARYDEVATTYDEQQQGAGRRLLDHLTLAAALPLLPPGGHVLDAGAGTGRFAAEFLRRGHAVTLLDPSEGMLEAARRRIQSLWPDGAAATFVPGGLEALPFPDRSFDLVFSEGDPLSYCVGTHHAAARELLRVLRPGGGFYVSCDNRWRHAVALLSQGRTDEAVACADEGRSLDPYGVPVHAFGPAELRAAFEDAGALEVRVAGKGVLSGLLSDDALEALWTREEDRLRLWALEERLAREPDLAATGAALHITGRAP